MAVLTYEAFSLMCPRSENDTRIWSIRKLNYALKQKKNVGGQRFPESFFESASKMVALELFHQGLLKNKKGRNLDPFRDLIHRNTKFRLKSTRKDHARAYDYLAFLGEVAQIDESQIEAYRRTAQDLRG